MTIRKNGTILWPSRKKAFYKSKAVTISQEEGSNFLKEGVIQYKSSTICKKVFLHRHFGLSPFYDEGFLKVAFVYF